MAGAHSSVESPARASRTRDGGGRRMGGGLPGKQEGVRAARSCAGAGAAAPECDAVPRWGKVPAPRCRSPEHGVKTVPTPWEEPGSSSRCVNPRPLLFAAAGLGAKLQGPSGPPPEATSGRLPFLVFSKRISGF